jgi:adenosylcobalamin-dependent ribonucleoside-triphosphate reductase
LEALHEGLRLILNRAIHTSVSKRTITDIMNMIGCCVVAGNVRRTAELAMDTGIDLEFLELKNYEVNPDRMAYGWSSNNSINIKIGSDYAIPASFTQSNGEPGYIWMENAKTYSRMNNGADYKDAKADGPNPCGEQTLESYELCCLVETFPHRCESLSDYQRTLKFAYLYAKTVTLGKTHWAETNRILLRNRRIGCSMSGIAQFVTVKGINTLREWCEEGYKTLQYYDKVYADWLCIPKSIKLTSVKPSGTVSLLAGATPGIHYPESRWYLRRVRLALGSPLVKPLQEAGYIIEPCVGQEDSTVVVAIPVKIHEPMRTLRQVTMWEQLEMAAFMQRYWADNQVSVTITFDPETEGSHIANALNFYQYRLKGVSFLPRLAKGAFAQMPYEEITEEVYNELAYKLSDLDFDTVKGNKAEVERFCDGEACVL